MLGVRTGIRPESVRFQAGHVLFVEGKDENALDPKVLSELFDHHLRIEPLGPAFSVKSVAEALHPHHPTYYFLGNYILDNLNFLVIFIQVTN